MRRLALAVALSFLAVAPAARANHAACFAPPPARLAAGDLRLTLLHQGAGELTYATAAPGDPDHLYVVERTGRIWRMDTATGAFDPRPFADLHSRVSAATGVNEDERGMQSLAFAPEYATSRRFYVFYSDRHGDSRVLELPSRRTLLKVLHSFSREHFGGQLAFGPDGRLYASLGDAQRWRWAQRKRLYGEIVALRPLRVVAKGLRNPFRFSFDAKGRMVIGDVGETRYEEVDVLRPRRHTVANFGWPFLEGPLRRFAGHPHHYVPPAISYSHVDGTAVVGGLTTGDGYLYADLCNGWIASAQLDRGTSAMTGLVLPFTTSFARDAAGRVYLTTARGEVYRLDGTTPSGPAAR